ncbi:MAG: hypothetical protein H6872_10565 [Methylobacteriaceae bacterium]|nr:hypothetical protein [Rhodoblastus sp.]MCC0005561.1 hypothetical protein [Methylobacteriaceae bacterium]
MNLVWKMALNSGRDDFKKDKSKCDEARKFCFANGWTGIGWQIEGIDDGTTNAELYGDYLAHSPYGRSAKSAHNALAHRMKDGDFVWCRTRDNIYWLGRADGPWTYRCVGDFALYDLFQVRACSWLRVGPSDLVPGPVKNAFAGRGSAISQFRSESESSLLMSASIWNGKTRTDISLPRSGHANLPLSAIGHDDLEDIVLFFIQAELKWYISVSSAKRSTPLTECVLRHMDGRRGYVQIKSGHSKMTTSLVKAPTDVDIFFLFDPSENEGSIIGKVHRIGAAELRAFIEKQPYLLPPYMEALRYQHKNDGSD